MTNLLHYTRSCLYVAVMEQPTGRVSIEDFELLKVLGTGGE